MPRPPRTRLGVEPLEDRTTPYVFGADGRVPADPLNGDTFRSGDNSIVRLEAQFPNGKQYFGSGVLVGTHYHVLTAGHLIHSKADGGYATHVRVTNTGVVGGFPTTVHVDAGFWRAETGFVNSGDLTFDLGLVTLKRNTPAGFSFVGGPLPMEAPADAALAARPTLATTGYPGDRSPNGVKKYTTTGPVSGHTGRTISSTIDTFKGQSGSPLLRPSQQTGPTTSNQPAVWGVNSHEYPDGSRPNVFARLSADRLAVFRKAIADDNAYYASLPPLPPGQLTYSYNPPPASGTRAAVVSAAPAALTDPNMPAVPLPEAPKVELPGDLTEGNAAAWTARAEGAGATAVLSDEPNRKLAGNSALRLITSGGFDVVAAYTVPGGVADVSRSETFHFFATAENSNFHQFQNGSPWVRLIDSAGNFFQYRYFVNGTPAELLNAAVGAWQGFDIPLAAGGDTATGWRRTATGSPDLSRLQTIEVHADTWDFGFALWLDDVSFRGYPLATASSLAPVNLPPAPFGPGPNLPTAPYPPGPNPDANTAFVKNLYRTVLGRDADSGGLAFWTASLATGMTRLAASRGFWNSLEHRYRQVENYYRTYLGRAADPDGRAFWANLLHTGAADEAGVALRFLQSGEADARAATPAAYVGLLYTTVLGRPADAAGKAFWVGRLETGSLTRGQVASLIVRSDESHLRVVTSFYLGFLRRGISAGDLEAWRVLMRPGTIALTDLAVGLLGCDEAYANARAAVG